MSTTVTANMMASPMGNVHPSTVTCKTILNAGLQLQGKDQLNKQMHEWQKRMDQHKQVERAVTANKLTYERNLRMMEMGARQGIAQDQHHYPMVSDSTVMLNNSNQVMVPIFVTLPSPLQMTFQSSAHLSTNLTSPYLDQHSSSIAELQNVGKDIDAIPHIPLPQEYISSDDYLSSCNQWLLWHQTMPPTPYMTSDPVTEHQAKDSNDPSLMRLDYLPFTSEDQISNIVSGRKDSLPITFERDDEDEINVIL